MFNYDEAITVYNVDNYIDNGVAYYNIKKSKS